MEVGDGNLGGRGPSHAASVRAVSAPNRLLADHSDSPFLESYRTPQTSLWEVLEVWAWLVPGASSSLPRSCLASCPSCPCEARIALPVCAVQGTSLGEAVSLMGAGGRMTWFRGLVSCRAGGWDPVPRFAPG